MTLYDAVCASVEACIDDGTLDKRKHAGAIEALKKLAQNCDNNDLERDNVTMPTMLKYFSALGMLPGGAKAPATGNQPAQRKKPTLVEFKGGMPKLPKSAANG